MNEKLKELWEFVELVKAMRRKQKDYFRTRAPQDLRESKDFEKRTDAALIELTGGKAPTLFGGGPDAA